MKNFKSFLLIFFIIVFCQPCFAATFKEEKTISVSATIGEKKITIFGYTSPNSKVELTNTNIYDLTFSDQKGYFEFNKILIPKKTSDLCLTATDENSRQTTPICLPPPPPANYQTSTGPIILPPTITVDNENIKPNSTVISSGQSIPDSEIEIYFYKINNKGLSFPKPVNAYSLPVFNTTSDSNGNFNFNLPTAYASNYRLFVSVKYKDYLSPRSNTLIYNMPSLSNLFWQQNYFYILSLPVFVVTLTIFFYIIFRFKSTPNQSNHLKL